MRRLGLKKRRKRLLALAGLTIAFLVYTVFWLFLYEHITSQIEITLSHTAYDDIAITSGSYTVNGYPFKPKISFSGEIAYQGTQIIIPDLQVKSFFLPGQPVEISAPQGLVYNGVITPPVSTVDRLYIQYTTPKFYPNTSSAASMSKWRADVGAVTVDKIEVDKGAFKFKAHGFIGIDNGLQPRMRLNTTSSGYSDLILLLKKAQFISPNEATIATAALNGLSEENPITGKRSVKIQLTLNQQQLSLGPIPVARLPLFDWDRRN